MPRYNWKPSKFPIPPRKADGFLNDVPRDHGRFDGIINRVEDGPVRDVRVQVNDIGSMGNGLLDGNRIQSRDNRHQLPSLLSMPIVPPNVHNGFDRRNNNMTPGARGFSGRENRRKPGEVNNMNNPNNYPRRNINPNDQINNKDKQQIQASDSDKEAMEAELSQAFFDRIVPLSIIQLANNVSLEFAQREVYETREESSMLMDKSFVAGKDACVICKLNFDISSKLLDHYKSADHKEIEALFKIKKNQARLIMQKKITQPNIRPNADMVAIVRAEVEMDLKPKEMELDPYILGVYESIMKPYWPSPNLSLYCRICNYAEFETQEEFENHNNSKEHKVHEDTYEEAFCLYCQVHTRSTDGKSEHDKTRNHLKIKNLMDKSKQCAIEHWHRVNEKPLPVEYRKKTQADRKMSNSSEKGEFKSANKRRASDSDRNSLKSPVKKFADKESMKDCSVKIDIDILQKEEPSVKDTAIANNSHLTSITTKKKDSVNSTNVLLSKKPFSRTESSLLPKEKVWFIPVTGYMCAACQVFVEEKNQKVHAREISHTTSVIRFKRQMNS